MLIYGGLPLSTLEYYGHTSGLSKININKKREGEGCVSLFGSHAARVGVVRPLASVRGRRFLPGLWRAAGPPPVPSDRRASRRSGCSLVPRPGRGLFMLGLVLVAYCSQQLAASHNHGQGDDHNHESNTGLWHRVGELFNREQIRQRKIKHGKADAVENGPKEISIFLPE